ncbi:ABC transporter [Streptomyces olivaceus]|uniref:ABC transporter permease subunit n=1 Tax=Streptomyces olivaceus TaxID=47716 RepID=UPI001CCE37E9|nr:ABC transporter permease subunit [Streptomyces olivaceus]MBZ6200824.1 ABC transporter permease [Streptomyces olivaceus]MBZ6205039.1 ABC transporter permease [Streptomyces olivaceus]GHJ01669.1 ABC transporter [Streptomyces olivaceus]
MSSLNAAVDFEWSKVRTVRSMVWSLVLCVALSLALAVVTGAVVRRQYADEPAPSSFDPVSAGFSGLRLGMIGLVVFGVLAVTSEYSTGTIRSSLAAVPRRGVFYAAKMLTGGLAAGAVSCVAVLTSFFLAQATMGEESVSLTDDGVPAALVGAVLFTTLLCLFSMGVAALLRSSVLTMGILMPLFFTVSTILTNIPGVGRAAQFLPDQAGGLALYRHAPDGYVLNAWSGLAVLAAWTAAALGAGYLALRRRDA